MEKHMSRIVGERASKHIVAKVCGISAQDDRFAAAEKVIATMKLAGFAKREIAKAEKMLAEAKARDAK